MVKSHYVWKILQLNEIENKAHVLGWVRKKLIIIALEFHSINNIPPPNIQNWAMEPHFVAIGDFAHAILLHFDILHRPLKLKN